MNNRRYVAERDYYSVLKLDPSATQKEIEAAYVRLSNNTGLRLNADYEREQAAQSLLAGTQAYQVLSSFADRYRYDRRRFGDRPTESQQFEHLFVEGLKAYRGHKLPQAIKCFEQVVEAYPHRPIYRVHLAIAYADHGWKPSAQLQIQMAMKIDPEDSFVQETAARLFFEIQDKKTYRMTWPKTNQVASMILGGLLLANLWYAGIAQKTAGVAVAQVQETINAATTDPQSRGYYRGGDEAREAETQSSVSDAKPLATQNTSPAAAMSHAQGIEQLPQDYKPSGPQYDYTSQKAVRKTFYPEQGIVSVNYEDGSILTYRPHELIGWKQDDRSQQAVMVTKQGEMIPSPADLPLLLPNGEEADLNSPEFPRQLFPEYSRG